MKHPGFSLEHAYMLIAFGYFCGGLLAILMMCRGCCWYVVALWVAFSACGIVWSGMRR